MKTQLVILALAALVGLLLWIGFRFRPRARPPASPPLPEPLSFDGTPDKPTGFGYKMIWIAVPAASAAELATALGLEDVVPCNWRSGGQAAYSRQMTHVFVTPPLDGWVLAGC